MANKNKAAMAAAVAAVAPVAPVAVAPVAVAPVAVAPVAVAPVAVAPVAQPTATLHYRRAHPGGGVLGRCSYGVPGVAGIVVFDMGLFANGVAPATLTLVGVALAQPTARKVAGVTSAVVAAGNLQVAQGTGTAIATPATVATVAAPATVAALAATK